MKVEVSETESLSITMPVFKLQCSWQLYDSELSIFKVFDKTYLVLPRNCMSEKLSDDCFGLYGIVGLE